MWERFSYYGMRGLLLYYLTKHFLFTDTHASQQYASYATLIYLVPLVGGLVADRWLGARRAVIFGGILLVLGHLGMAFEGQPNHQTLIYHGQTYEYALSTGKAAVLPKLKVGDAYYEVTSTPDSGRVIQGLPAGAPLPSTLAAGSFSEGVKTVTSWGEKAFFLSISLIVMGVGFLKANISTLVGQLYKDRDPRRDSGFQLYYFGINLGSFWAAVICGYLGETVGWWAGFGAAGVGMLAGLIGFLVGKPWLMGKGESPDPEGLKSKLLSFLPRETLIYVAALLGIPLIYFLVQYNQIVFIVLAIATLGMLGYIAYNMFTRFTRLENFRIALALILSVASVVFFALEELAGSALSLFADRNIDLNLLASPVSFDLFGKTVLLASREQLAAMTMPTGDYLWVDVGLTAAQTQTINT
ncbi:MAG: MFS transporter, partial [Asticcacaulis sp.]|nr:MFS transporter [Asticcacaulis sp.]